MYVIEFGGYWGFVFVLVDFVVFVSGVFVDV